MAGEGEGGTYSRVALTSVRESCVRQELGGGYPARGARPALCDDLESWGGGVGGD